MQYMRYYIPAASYEIQKSFPLIASHWQQSFFLHGQVQFLLQKSHCLQPLYFRGLFWLPDVLYLTVSLFPVMSLLHCPMPVSPIVIESTFCLTVFARTLTAFVLFLIAYQMHEFLFWLFLFVRPHLQAHLWYLITFALLYQFDSVHHQSDADTLVWFSSDAARADLSPAYPIYFYAFE